MGAILFLGKGYGPDNQEKYSGNERGGKFLALTDERKGSGPAREQ